MPSPEGKKTTPRKMDELVDETGEETFPASDPPAWTGTHAGEPKHPSDRHKNRH